MLSRSDTVGGRSEAPFRRHATRPGRRGRARRVRRGRLRPVARDSSTSDPPPLAAPIDPKLPDLTVGPLTGITGGLNEDGTQSVRFGVMIVNQGEGDFLLRARRSNALADDWQVTQRIVDVGGYTEKPSEATLVYGGDGHNHWHVKEVESHVIEDLDGNVLGSVVKSGFCFFDTDAVRPDLPGAPAAKVYASEDCGGQFDSANLMGLSVGWGDEYPWHLFEQEIDITDLPEGRYRLRATADPFELVRRTR